MNADPCPEPVRCPFMTPVFDRKVMKSGTEEIAAVRKSIKKVNHLFSRE